MTIRFALLKTFAIALVASVLILPSANSAEPTKTKQSDRGPKDLGAVLVFSGTGWYRHPETAAINGWLARLQDDLGMQIDVTETPKDLEKLLSNYKVLVMNNCNELTSLLDAKQRKSVETWYKNGGGIVALHAALVHQTEWPWFNELAGCDFNSDSEFLEAKVNITPEAMNNPAFKGAKKEFMITADWTNHDRSVTGRKGFTVLARVDESSFDPVRDYFKKKNGIPMGKDHPITWINTLNNGRFFYTDLGHDVRSLNTPFGKQHIVGAIQWAARLEE